MRSLPPRKIIEVVPLNYSGVGRSLSSSINDLAVIGGHLSGNYELLEPPAVSQKQVLDDRSRVLAVLADLDGRYTL